jgi:hypothetical protein
VDVDAELATLDRNLAAAAVSEGLTVARLTRAFFRRHVYLDIEGR